VNMVAITLLSYFLGGLVVLAIFDLTTKRIRDRLLDKAAEAYNLMAGQGTYMGRKLSIVLFAILLWLFWPAVLLGSARSEASRENKIQRREATGRYGLKKLWYGECPDCHVILIPEGWSGAVCPVCERHFGMLIRRSKNGTQGQRANSKNTGRGGGANIVSSETDSK